MSDGMSVRKAISVVAHHLLADALDAAISAENIGWEDYPEVGERDFDKVAIRAGSNRVVSVRPVGPHGVDGRGTQRQSQVSRFAHVVACPQCTGALGLLQVLSPHGGDAA